MMEAAYTVLQSAVANLYSITLPCPPCSSPWSIHLDYEELKYVSQQWVKTRFSSHLPSAGAESCHGPSYAHGLLRDDLTLLSCVAYPKGMRSRMIPIVKLMYWFFIIDNILDEPSEMGTDTESADVLLARVVDVMEGREESESRTKLNVCVKKQKTIAIIVDTAREWWNEMRALGMSCRLQARMVKSMTEYLNAHRFLIIHRSSSPQAVLDMENYLHYRGMAGGWWPCLVAMEFGLDLHLEEEVLSHPYIRALQRSTAWHVYWVNDVASFKKELLEDNIQCNLIPVLYVKRVIETEARRSKTGIELQTVVNEATSIIREEDANWVRLVSDIRSCEMLMPTGNEQPCLRRRQDLETYMEAMGHWRSGNLYYHLASERYGICATIDGYVQAPDFRANYVVRLQN